MRIRVEDMLVEDVNESIGEDACSEKGGGCERFPIKLLAFLRPGGKGRNVWNARGVRHVASSVRRIDG